jgi:hypothetical protein
MGFTHEQATSEHRQVSRHIDRMFDAAKKLAIFERYLHNEFDANYLMSHFSVGTLKRTVDRRINSPRQKAVIYRRVISQASYLSDYEKEALYEYMYAAIVEKDTSLISDLDKIARFFQVFDVNNSPRLLYSTREILICILIHAAIEGKLRTTIDRSIFSQRSGERIRISESQARIIKRYARSTQEKGAVNRLLQRGAVVPEGLKQGLIRWVAGNIYGMDGVRQYERAMSKGFSAGMSVEQHEILISIDTAA